MDQQQLVEDMGKKVNAILVLLRGNSEVNPEDKGFISQVNDMNKRMNKLEKWFERGIYILIGMAVPASFGIARFVGEVFFKLP